MKLLLFGYSDFAKRVVLPALAKVKHYQLVGIASQSRHTQIPRQIPAFSSYINAMAATKPDIVYISLHNSAHEKWVYESLARGFHVIVDKPGILSPQGARKTYELARKKKLFVSEAFQFMFHKQHVLLKKLLAKYNLRNVTITIRYGFPQKPKANFRNFPSLGGGCVNDTAPYLVATGRHYFNRYPSQVLATGVTNNQGLVTHASIILAYDSNHTLFGDIGFDRVYHNALEIWGDTVGLSLTRAFSITPHEKNSIDVWTKKTKKTIPVATDDAMANYLNAVFHDITNNTRSTDDIYYQSKILWAIRESLRKNRAIKI